MKYLIIYLLFCVCFSVSTAQEWKANVSYNYLYAPTWDKAIQTHNFSRPFLDIKQPLLMHGMQAAIARVFKSNRNIHHGMQLAYAQFRNNLRVHGYSSILHSHFLKIGYILQFKPIPQMDILYTEVHLSLITGALCRRIKSVSPGNNISIFCAMSIGGEANVITGYYILKNPGYKMSLFVNIGYTPFLFSPEVESVLNQTKGFVGKPWTQMMTAQVGVAFHFLRRKDI